jgi:hypothetical protein
MESDVPDKTPASRAPRKRPARRPGPSVAALLAQTLADDDWWAVFAALEDEEDWRDAMAFRALELYRLTAPFIRARGCVAGKADPVDNAVGVLREIADACALQSYRWTPDERATLRIPTRAALESSIRLSGVDSWVRGLGHELALAQPGGPAEAWPIAPPNSEESAPNDLARRFGDAALLYGVVMEARAAPDGWHVLRAEVFRRGACQEVGVARGWLLWTTGYLGADALPLAHAMLLMGQMFFVASRDATFAEELFPSDAFLRELLASTGGAAWLTDHGCAPPEWLGLKAA